jgi:putative oxidoreductase
MNANKWMDLIARVLLAQIFVIAGIGKITDYSGTQEYMASGHVPGLLLPAVILLELGGGAALVVGWRTRPISIALAAFSILAALLFHANLKDDMQTLLFLKDLAIAGGLLLLGLHGAGYLSLDGRSAPNPGRK